MDETYNKDLCEEKHTHIEKLLDEHETRLNNHSNRIDALEGDNRELKTEMKNVCKDIQNLISTIKWGLGIFVTVALFVLGYLIKMR
jgi:peptidoglycan hydrolase CwlO-like protein